MIMKIPVDLILIFGPSLIYFFISLIIFSGVKTGGGSWFPATSERDDAAIIFYPISFIVGLILWGICLKFKFI